MNNPNWQRARALEWAQAGESLIVWVRLAPPAFGLTGLTDASGRPTGRYEVCAHYETNIVGPLSITFVLAANKAELLARGPDDFAEDVPLVKWEDWLTQRG